MKDHRSSKLPGSALRATALLLLLLAPAAGAQDATEAAQADAAFNLGEYFAGEWAMEGRFRYDPAAPWIPTKSRLVASSKLGGRIVSRDIEAPQIRFKAYDVITHNPADGSVQYLYVNDQGTEGPTALLYEGTCEEACRRLEFRQVCGSRPVDRCGGRTNITIESNDHFVARDFLPRAGSASGEMMTREVHYRRTPPRND